MGRLRVRARIRRLENTVGEDSEDETSVLSSEGSFLDCSPTDALPVDTKLAVYSMDISTSTGTTDVATAYVEAFAETPIFYMTFREGIFHCGHARQLGLPQRMTMGMEDHDVFRADAFW